ncbi:NADH-quinone oxidoreductase subunit NuoE [soil metagenome]
MNVLPEDSAELETMLARYPSRRSGLLPVLWRIQNREGWISQESMRQAAEIIGCTAAEVYEVVSFYTMYNQKPTGKVHIQFCHTLSCAICGAHEAVAYIKDKYGFRQHADRSDDGRFSMVEVECIGACSEAPAMLVGETLYGNLTPQRIDEILSRV